MNLYTKYIFPKLVDANMRMDAVGNLRPDVVSKVKGVVLEVGYGSGLNTEYYRGVTRLYALEPHAGLIEIAERRRKRVDIPIEYLQVSAENIPLRDGVVDGVISTRTLCSIPKADIALREIFRVLKPQGVFSFMEHGRAPDRKSAVIQRLVTPFTKMIAGGCHLDRDIEGLIRGAGFHIQTLEKFGQKTRPLDYIYRGVAVKLGT